MTHQFSLAFPWRDKAAGTHGSEEIAITAQHPREQYGEFRFEAQSRGYDYLSSRDKAVAYAFCARSLVAFMDATGLRRSNAWAAVFGPVKLLDEGDFEARGHESGQHAPGFDHTSVWRDASGRYAVTTEPYNTAADQADAWCEAHGWQHHLFPVGVGMWNPAGALGTRLVLTSPPKNGAPIAPLVPKLLKAMPRWTESEAIGE